MKRECNGIEMLRAARLASESHQRRRAYMREYAKTDKCRKYHREYQRELRAYRRSLGVCAACGKEDAFGNFSRCAACLEKETLYAIHRKEAREKAAKNPEGP